MAPKRDGSDLSSPWLVDSWIESSQSNLDPNFGFIESLYQTCTTTLQQLCKSRSSLSLTDAQQTALKNDVAQLRLWEENFPSCRLDTILSHSNYLRIEVLKNLGSARSEHVYFIEEIEDLSTLLEKVALIVSENDTSDSSIDSDTDSDSSLMSEAGKNQQGKLHCYIGCLMELGPSIERQIGNVQYKLDQQASLELNRFSLSEKAQPFAIRIKDRFKNAKVSLVERLAEANWERSVRMMTHAEQGNEVDSARSVPATAMTLFKPFSIFYGSGLETSVPSRPHYANTVASHSSFISMAGEEDEGRPRVPPLPLEVEVLSRAQKFTQKPDFEDHICQLCLTSGWQTMESYATHVGRHLEEISLACLPKVSDDATLSDSNASQESIMAATMVNTARFDKVASHISDTGPDYTSPLNTVSGLGSPYYNKEGLKGKEEMYQRALAGSETVLDPQHPDTLTSDSQLGSVLNDQGKHEEAEAMDQRALRGSEKALGHEHSDTLTSVSQLGSVLDDLGKFQEAEANTNEDWTKISDLAERRRIQNRIAKRNYRKKLKRRLEDLEKRAATASESPERTIEKVDTLKPANTTKPRAKGHRASKSTSDVNRHVPTGSPRSREGPSPEHRHALTNASRLVSVLDDQGNYEEAEAMDQRALQGLEKVLGPEHPDALTSMASLATMYFDQEHLVEAEELEL
ncbi:hypothetical protein FE257_005521 [Aspergillus nanangensis]|uniref:Uncharacterized protein n=1 Tax=Aspergillus nanangensis TaxID=2582783 RepID=A0AAD4CA58_ASPNN|nr:hypothetical protein FE257_005521 [Aspergillus nanangensis]